MIIDYQLVETNQVVGISTAATSVRGYTYYLTVWGYNSLKLYNFGLTYKHSTIEKSLEYPLHIKSIYEWKVL